MSFSYSKTLTFLFYLFIFLFSIKYSLALTLQKIEYDPPGADTDREWLEIYNDTQNSIDLTQIKFFENNVNHGIDIFNVAQSTDKNISAGETIILAQDINKYKIDYPNYSGKIFKSSFSLSNTGEVLSLKDKAGNVLFTVDYTSQIQNTSTSTSATTNSSATSTSSNAISTTTATVNTETSINYFYKSYWPETEKIYVKAGENKVIMQGQEITFNPKILDGNKKEIKFQNVSNQYRWSFGDGYTSDKREGLHAYKFTGEFVVNLEVNANGYVDEDKLYIKVVEPSVGVKIVEKEINGNKVDVIELENKNTFELNLGNLTLKDQNNKSFILPEKLTILPNHTILLPPELTGFSSSTEKVFLSLLNGTVLSSFERSQERPKGSPTLALPNREGIVRTSANIVQVFTGEQYNNLQNNSEKQAIKILATTTTKFVKKFYAKPVVENKTSETVAQTNPNTSTNLNSNPNKIEFKNEKEITGSDMFSKLKSLWRF